MFPSLPRLYSISLVLEAYGKGLAFMRFLRHLGILLKEFGQLAWHQKAWWLVPIVLVLLILALLIFTGAATAPYIYPFW